MHRLLETLNNIPDLISEYAAYANPYRILHAHGIAIEQSGKFRPVGSTGWKKITSLNKFSYPLVEFNSQLSSLGFSLETELRNELGKLKIKNFGFSKLKTENKQEVQQAAIALYLAHLPWMPWAFGSEHVIVEEYDSNSIQVAMAAYPEEKALFLFSESGRIDSLYMKRHQIDGKSNPLMDWKVSYGKYNIKKSYKVPTQVEFAWINQGEEFAYLNLEKITGFSVL